MKVEKAKCRTCGLPFGSGEIKFQGEVIFKAVHCDACIEKREREQKEETARKIKAKQHAEQTRIWESACPKYYRNFDPEKCPATETSRASLRGLVNAKNLYLYGESGGGKTFLAWQVAKHRAFHCGEDVATTTGMDFRELFYPVSDEREKAEKSAKVKELRTAKLLIFDDIGQMLDSEAGSEKMFALIEGRIKANRGTILTSNYKPASLVNRFRPEELAKALTRRIEDYFHPVEIKKQ